MQPFGDVISKALAKAVNGVSAAVVAACSPAARPGVVGQAHAAAAAGHNTAAGAAGALPGGVVPRPGGMLLGAAGGGVSGGGPGALLANEVTQEGLAAAALVDVMLQVCGVLVGQGLVGWGGQTGM